MVILTGLASIGKTQIAKKYAHDHSKEYDIVWWINANTDLNQAYKDLVREINKLAGETILLDQPLEVLRHQVREYMRTSGKDWLLIFDDAHDAHDMERVDRFIPNQHAGMKGHILVTSKNRGGWNKQMDVEKFQRSESIKFLTSVIGEGKENLNTLAETLGDYPLALAQAAAFLKLTPSLSVEEYITFFTKQRQKLWEMEKEAFEKKKQGPIALLDNHMTVYTTLHLIIEKLKQEKKTAFDLLSCCAFLHHQHLPEKLIKMLVKGEEDTVGGLDALRVLSSLINYSLLQKDVAMRGEKPTYTLHETVQRATQDYFTLEALSGEGKRFYLKKVLESLAHIIPNKMDWLTEYVIKNPYMIEHMKKATFYARQLDVHEPSLFVVLLRMLEYYVSIERDFSIAETVIEHLEHLIPKLSRIDDITLAQYYIIKGTYYRWKTREGIPGLSETLKAEKILQKHPKAYEEQLRVCNSLAQVYLLYLGDLKNASFYSDKGASIVEKAEGYLGNQDAFYSIRSKISLEKGQVEEAWEAIQKAIKMSVLDPDNLVPGSLYVLVSQTEIQIYQGKYKEARDNLERLYQKALKILPSQGHELIADILTLLASANKGEGNLLKAQELIEEAVHILKKRFNEQHKDLLTARTYKARGEIYEALGELEVAYESYRKAQENYQGVYKKVEIASLNELYGRLAIMGAKLGDDFVTKSYLSLQKKHFGTDNPYYQQVIDYLKQNNLTPL